MERDELVCVSTHKKFLRPQESQQFIKLKANWTRACKRRGHRPNDVNAILFNTTTDSVTKVFIIIIILMIINTEKKILIIITKMLVIKLSILDVMVVRCRSVSTVAVHKECSQMPQLNHNCTVKRNSVDKS